MPERDEVNKLRARVERLQEGLRRLEWINLDPGERGPVVCPACESVADEEGLFHSGDCWLAALLSEPDKKPTAEEETLFGHSIDSLAEALTESMRKPR